VTLSKEGDVVAVALKDTTLGYVRLLLRLLELQITLKTLKSNENWLRYWHFGDEDAGGWATRWCGPLGGGLRYCYYIGILVGFTSLPT